MSGYARAKLEVDAAAVVGNVPDAGKLTFVTTFNLHHALIKHQRADGNGCEGVGCGLWGPGLRDEVVLGDLDSRLLFEFLDRRSGEAATGFRCSDWDAPGAVVGALGEENSTVVSSQGDHRSWHQHQLASYRLAQSPQIGTGVGHAGRG